MTELDLEAQMKILIEHERDPVFNDWEQKFIEDLKWKKYENLTQKQRLVVSRLYSWWKGR